MLTAIKSDFLEVFAKIAPYLKNPFVLAGFVLLLLLIALLAILQFELLPDEQAGWLNFLKGIYLYGFAIVLVLVLGGFFLEFKKFNLKKNKFIQKAHDKITRNRKREVKITFE